MREVFKGWKRKIGGVLLVIVLPFLLGWVRSITLADFIGLLHRESTYFVVSHGGMLNFEISTPMSPAHPPSHPTDGFDRRPQTVITVTQPLIPQTPYMFWGTHHLKWFDQMIGVRAGTVEVGWSNFDVEWQRHIGQLEFVVGNDKIHRAKKLVVPYWSIVIPLTLISFWLLLSKPNKSNQNKTAQPPGIESGHHA